MQKIYLSDAGPKVSSAIYGFWRWSAEVDSVCKKTPTIFYHPIFQPQK